MKTNNWMMTRRTGFFFSFLPLFFLFHFAKHSFQEVAFHDGEKKIEPESCFFIRSCAEKKNFLIKKKFSLFFSNEEPTLLL